METIRLKSREQDYETREETKVLRTNLLFCGSDKKVILVTSCLAGEGKSTITMNLAKSLAEIKKKVLLIDVDLRKSVLGHQVNGERPKKGLTHYLSGQASIADIIYLNEDPKFHIIFAGPLPPNPAELLASKAFERLIQKCREAYDYILLDCAPLGMVVDAAVVAAVCIVGYLIAGVVHIWWAVLGISLLLLIGVLLVIRKVTGAKQEGRK